MHHPMVPANRGFSPSYDRLLFAIDRFLAGKITPMQLQSWCYAHFDQPESTGNEREMHMWQQTLTNLSVFHRCDFHRSVLEESLAMVRASIETTGSPCATPLTTSDCWYEIQRSERR